MTKGNGIVLPYVGLKSAASFLSTVSFATFRHGANTYKQLGYSRATTLSDYGQGNGRIWISNINCHFGSYSRLDDCPFSRWGVRNCSHSGSASVMCGKTITIAVDIAVFCL